MKRVTFRFLLASSLILLDGTSHAFQPVVKPHFLSNGIQKTLQKQASKKFNLSSGLISHLAELALKKRLARHTDVSCHVTSSSPDLVLRGRVGAVAVKGKSWQSALGLTCRAIEANVESCEIDVGQMLTKKKLSLNRPALGEAKIALDNVDFANFITHPLMKAPVMEGSEKASVAFIKEGTQVDAETGFVTFFADHEGRRWKCLLRRGESKQERAVVEVLHEVEGLNMETPEKVAAKMASSLSTFFNEMVFEIDGISLSFGDLMVTGKGASPCVIVALNIMVKKLPSRSAAF